ncbi:MAG TPA: glycosyl hydrolase family 65 protein [Streptosporangiaceae bacterium]|nr:glycosyl hydrolase family 65 protein [Streptosporangiaceae bacterium]
MIPGEEFETEAWSIRETSLNRDRLAQSESIFALSNGHIGVRGNLDEGEPHGLPGTYLNGFYEARPLPYAEAGYGYPEAGQTVVNVTNGKIIRLLVDDELFDLRYGRVLHHERTLNFRTGLLQRQVEWRSPGHRSVRVRSTRMVSLVQRAVMAIEYEVEVLDGPGRVVVQSELVANEDLPPVSGDPRVAAALEHPLECLEHRSSGVQGYLAHRTRRSGLQLAAAMDHLCDAPDPWGTEVESYEDSARVTVIAELKPGTKLCLTKLVAYGWSAERSVPALRDQVAAALAAARHTGWDGMLAEQREFLDRYWEVADVRVDGDPEIQQAVRFATFQVLQAGARAEGRAIPAKGLTGPGYDGHAFWDTESYVLPVLTYTLPTAVADALKWRHSILPQAKERARQLGLAGAAFPWRTIAGEECSAYWPAGTAAFHVTADVADAVARFQTVAGTDDYARRFGTELLVETARLWVSLGYFDMAGEFRIDGVTGPDEYSAVMDNNVYTNLMAKRNLEKAVAAITAPGTDRSNWPGVSDDELSTWQRAAEHMRVPYDERLRVHPQADEFTDHAVWGFDVTTPSQYPLLLNFPYFDLYRKQVVKQADLVLALYRAGHEFTDEQKQRDFEYYERLTVRDSSLSASIQAIMAAETGHLDLAYDYWGEAALMDLGDLERNTSDGLHIASLAGSWLVAVAGFGGLRDTADGILSLQPRLPGALRSLTFNLLWRGAHLNVAISPGQVRYTCNAESHIDLLHYGEKIRVGPGGTQVRDLPPVTERPRPRQPPGREPAQRNHKPE